MSFRNYITASYGKKIYSETQQLQRVKVKFAIVTNQLLFLESHAKVIPNKITYINPLNAKFTKRPNTLKQFVGSRRIVWVCLVILWDWRLKG